MWLIVPLILMATLAIGIILVVRMAKQRHMQHWLGSYAAQAPNRVRERQFRTSCDTDIHLFIAVCDHYEPEWSRPASSVSQEKVKTWIEKYPLLFDQFRDSNGRPPQHTFFFPQDEYKPEYLDQLALLCQQGFGDVDIHLHHDGDSADELRDKLISFRDSLFHDHGLLRRDHITNRIVYGFIHGNWALCNSRPDKRWCGVDREIPILKETGCYADFTMPSAPSDTQTSTINGIYYASDIPGQSKSHDTGVLARVGEFAPDDALLMIQGPLVLDWHSRRLGLLPRTENGDLHQNQPPHIRRLPLWMNAHVHVQGQPNWYFIKLHTHGCKDGNLEMLLGETYQQFHRDLSTFIKANENIHLHYVTAWEMAQLVHQAEEQNVSLDLLNHPILTS